MPSIPRMPWGKHRGIPLNEIDSGYLQWVVDVATATSRGLREDVNAELTRRRRQQSLPPPLRASCPDPAVAADLVQAGKRALAKKHHPDRGGNLRLMQMVNAVADWLKAQVPQ